VHRFLRGRERAFQCRLLIVSKHRYTKRSFFPQRHTALVPPPHGEVVFMFPEPRIPSYPVAPFPALCCYSLIQSEAVELPLYEVMLTTPPRSLKSVVMSLHAGAGLHEVSVNESALRQYVLFSFCFSNTHTKVGSHPDRRPSRQSCSSREGNSRVRSRDT
jgi:hypothetical protein